MANITDCMTNIIGVSRKDCECLSEDLDIPAGTDPVTPADDTWYKTSTSGYYIDELDGIVSIDAVKDVVYCEKLYEFFEKIIENSIRDASDDVSASISERYKKKESNFVGFIGSRTSGKALNLSGNLAGLKIEVAETTGGVLVIKGIGILLNTTAEFDIMVYRRYVETNLFELVDTIEGINSTANTYTENVFVDKLMLPMQIDNEDEIEYYFIYDLNGMQPRNNLASCGCGHKEHRLRKMINYGGVSGNDIEELGSWNMTEFGNGIVLDCELRCNAEAIICVMYNQSPEWSKYLAHAVIYKAAWKIHKAILSSPNITQEIMANRETVEQNMNLFDSEYWIRIKWLVQNVDLALTDCYTCDNKKLKVTQILL